MNLNGVVLAAGKGPIIHHTAPGRSFTLKLQNGETAESVMMFKEVAPAGTVTTFHTHRESDKVAYVLSGEITFKIGDEVTIGGTGTCAFMPRDVPHAWKSTGVDPGRVLFLYTPGRAGKLFEELLHRPFESLTEQERVEMNERHGTEIVGPPPF